MGTGDDYRGCRCRTLGTAGAGAERL